MTQDFKPRRAEDKNPAHPPKKSNTKLVLGFGMLAGIGLSIGAMSFLGMTPATVTQKQAKGSTPLPAVNNTPVQVVQEHNRQQQVALLPPANNGLPPAAPTGTGTTTTTAPEPLPLPGKPGDAPQEKRFQFYDILPGKSEAVPSGKPDDGKAKKDEKAEKADKVAKEKAAKDAKAAKSAEDLLNARDSEKPAVAKDTRKEADKPAEVKKEETKPGKPVTLQAGAFSSESDADNQKAKLAMQGIEAKVVPVQVQDKTLYRVRFGRYASAEEAARVQADLKSAGIATTLIK